MNDDFAILGRHLRAAAHRRTKARRRRHAAIALVILCAVATASLASASLPFNARQDIEALRGSASSAEELPGTSFQIPGTGDPGANASDPTSMHVLRDRLGPYNSRIVAYTSLDRGRICVYLLGHAAGGIGMGFCSRPDTDPAFAGLHFIAAAPWTSGLDGTSTQVFGVATDQVRGIRVLTNGQWLNASLTDNAFYLDLPGHTSDDVQQITATLESGDSETYRIPHRTLPSTSTG
jgi:hypothetical protein